MILITGATGFLGAELAKQLCLAGKKIKAGKRKNSQIPDFLTNNNLIEWVDMEMSELDTLGNALEGVSQVYHCAAKVSFLSSDKKQLFKTNIEGTANLVNLCLDRQIRLLHVSSVAALGEAKTGQMISEKNFWEYQPNAKAYALSKYRSEMEVWRGITEGLNALIVNPSIIIGKDSGTKGSGALFFLVKNKLKFYTKGSIGFVDVSDVAACMILLMNSSIQAERFIINAENWSYKAFFEKIASVLQQKPPHIQARPWMLEIAWRANLLFSIFMKKQDQLSKETARSSFKQSTFTNEKVIKQLNFNFKPIEQSIKEICSTLQP